ncbi:MAG: tetratricopeptide repeat protein [Myxococcota bacterium]
MPRTRRVAGGPAADPVPAQRSGRHAGTSILALTLVGLLASACSSLGGPSGPFAGGGDDRLERPEAPADYDVLVGSLASLEGRPGDARAAFERAAEKDPESAYLQRSLGRLAAQLDDLDAALAHARRAVELAPEDEEARIFLGRLHRIRRDVGGAEAALLDEDGQPFSPEAAILLYQIYLESGQLARALAVAERVAQEHPDILGGHMAVATAYERMGRREQAEAALRRAIEYHPGRFVLFSRLARMRRAAGDREGEIAVYREALGVDPDRYGTLVSLAEAQIAVEDFPGAIATYRQILERYPDDIQSIRRLASLEYASGDHEQAAARLADAIDRHPQHIELAYALGQVFRGIGDEERALEAFRRVPPTDTSYPEARLRIADILETREEFDAALEEVEAARAIRPNRPLDFRAATLMWRSGDFEGGVSLLEGLLAEDPDDDEILYQIGVLYGLDKRIDEALAYMDRALEKNPENPHALNYIGYTWAERGENLDAAEELILRALAIRPDDGYITDSLGWVYYMRARPLVGQGQMEDAQALLERAREHLAAAAVLTGGDPVVSEHLGDVHLLLDEKAQALEFYEEAVRLEPREEEQPNLMEKLEKLRQELGVR